MIFSEKCYELLGVFLDSVDRRSRLDNCQGSGKTSRKRVGSCRRWKLQEIISEMNHHLRNVNFYFFLGGLTTNFGLFGSLCGRLCQYISMLNFLGSDRSCNYIPPHSHQKGWFHFLSSGNLELNRLSCDACILPAWNKLRKQPKKHNRSGSLGKQAIGQFCWSCKKIGVKTGWVGWRWEILWWDWKRFGRFLSCTCRHGHMG